MAAGRRAQLAKLARLLMQAFTIAAGMRLYVVTTLIEQAYNRVPEQ
jgi:hypothetical protein